MYVNLFYFLFMPHILKAYYFYSMVFSCIIPAYNEAPRIHAILQVALHCSELDEVIVIDDGSTDETKKILEDINHPKLQKLFLEKNGGKMKAFFT